MILDDSEIIKRYNNYNIYIIDNVILDDKRRLLKDVTNEELIIIFHNIDFNECIDVIKKDKITGKLLACVKEMIHIEELDFPINRAIRKNLLYEEIIDMIQNGVPNKYLNRQVIYIYIYHNYYTIIYSRYNMT